MTNIIPLFQTLDCRLAPELRVVENMNELDEAAEVYLRELEREDDALAKFNKEMRDMRDIKIIAWGVVAGCVVLLVLGMLFN